MESENVETPKAQRLSRLNTPFLFELANELNGDSIGSYRDYSGYDREGIIELISNKLSVEDTEVVVGQYLLCKSPSDVASRIKPGSVENIRNSVERHFGENCLVEVKVGRRTCDVVFPNSLIAVEIKSARDKVEEATKQLEHHSSWADKLFLAYDSAHELNVPDDLSTMGVGLLEYDEEEVELVREPDLIEHSAKDYLSSMIYDHLERLADNRGLDTRGGKEELVKRLDEAVSKAEAKRLFKAYLGTRS